MTVTKDVEGYFGAQYSGFLKTFSQCAVDNTGHTSITSMKLAYKFDDIAQAILRDKSTSVDCIFFRKKFIELIEFKGGIIDRFESNYKPLNYTCSNCNYLHEEHFKQLKERHKNYKKVLHQNLQLKIVETLLILTNHIFPKCTETDYPLRIRLICVVNTNSISPLDALEIQYNDTAKIKSGKDEISKLICKYAKPDCFGEKIFLDEFKVMMDSEFNSIPAYN